MPISFRTALGAVVLSVAGSVASAGTVLVNGDEWALTDTGFSNAGGTNMSTFVSNLVAEFGTTIHAHSTNFGYTEGSLATAMTSAGATYTTGLLATFDLPTLSGYDAIFLGGNYLSDAEEDVLSDYVAGGGNVFISAGTGVGGAAAEAAAWNDFLIEFDIVLAPSYTGFFGTVDSSGASDPLFAGVDWVFIGNPNGLSVSGPDGSVICCGDRDLFAVSRMDSTPEVPLPGGLPLLAGGVMLLGWYRRRA